MKLILVLLFISFNLWLCSLTPPQYLRQIMNQRKAIMYKINLNHRLLEKMKHQLGKYLSIKNHLKSKVAKAVNVCDNLRSIHKELVSDGRRPCHTQYFANLYYNPYFTKKPNPPKTPPEDPLVSPFPIQPISSFGPGIESPHGGTMPKNSPYIQNPPSPSNPYVPKESLFYVHPTPNGSPNPVNQKPGVNPKSSPAFQYPSQPQISNYPRSSPNPTKPGQQSNPGGIPKPQSTPTSKNPSTVPSGNPNHGIPKYIPLMSAGVNSNAGIPTSTPENSPSAGQKNEPKSTTSPTPNRQPNSNSGSVGTPFQSIGTPSDPNKQPTGTIGLPNVNIPTIGKNSPNTIPKDSQNTITQTSNGNIVGWFNLCLLLGLFLIFLL